METVPISYVQAAFAVARDEDKVDHYEKFKKVDARPAIEGEEIVTIINGEEETKSTAKKGDFIVRSKGKNKEEYTVDGDKFKKRYEIVEGSEADEDGFQEYDPTGDCYAFKYDDDDFTFVAPWGEDMIVKSGDFIASIDLENLDDIYRIEKDEFIDTYKKMG